MHKKELEDARVDKIGITALVLLLAGGVGALERLDAGSGIIEEPQINAHFYLGS